MICSENAEIHCLKMTLNKGNNENKDIVIKMKQWEMIILKKTRLNGTKTI